MALNGTIFVCGGEVPELYGTFYGTMQQNNNVTAVESGRFRHTPVIAETSDGGKLS